jgi:hypothetical protein
MNDPINFIKSLENNSNDDFRLPTRQSVYLLPDIDWEKYYNCVDISDLETIKNQKIQRTINLRQTTKKEADIHTTRTKDTKGFF